MTRFPRAALLITGVVALSCQARLFAQERSRLELQAKRAAVAPRLDGVLNEDVWSGDPFPLDPWVSYNPIRGEPARYQTNVWIAYDDKAIYIAFHCIDPEPEKIRTNISRRDAALDDDWVAVSLDSTAAGQIAYHMFINPSGIQADALNSGSNGEDFAPDWVWQSAGHVDPDGYSVEMRLPLESIRFRSGADVRMGVAFFRRVSRLGLSWSWPEMAPGKWVFDVHAPLLFETLHQPLLLEVIPSTTFSRNQSRSDLQTWNDTVSKGKLGASVKYGVTSTITLDATVNPDFSQVESDQFEVEINQRYPVFFSEKRPFFMEGLGLFNLAGTGNDANMRTAVHTRRIIEPSAGVKLTGSAGAHTFGLLSAGDKSIGGGDQRLFTIGRGVRNLGVAQYVGVLATDTEFAGEHNRVVGGDLALQSGEHFRWNGSFLFAHSRSLEGQTAHGVASQGTYSYNSHRWTLVGQAEHYDRGFQMDTAFLNRVGITRTWNYQEFQFYPDASRYRWITRVAPFTYLTAAEDRIQGGSEFFGMSGIRFNFTRQGYLRLDIARGHETFARQRFRNGRLHADGGGQITRWLNVAGYVESGPATYYDAADPFQGSRRALNLRLGYQPNAKLNHSLSYTFVTFERTTPKENVYDVHVVNLRNTYQFTSQFLMRALAQFDSSRRRVLGDFLASYELVPGTVVHCGYGSLFERAETGAYIARARAFFFKASYLARF